MDFVGFQVLTAVDNLFTRQYNPEDSSELQHGLCASPSDHAVWGIGLDRLDAETVGSHPA
jgi:hypothetical protein